MPIFAYSAANLSELERTLSIERLTPYLSAAQGNRELAFNLYEQNVFLSESLYGVLQGLEVALRNGIHSQLSFGLGRQTWWDVLPLHKEQEVMVREAKSRLVRAGKPLDPGRVVAELSFGFWTGLTGPKYDGLWRKHLVKVFPRRPVQRNEAQIRLNGIRKLRNRVAHHEAILNRPLLKDVNQIFDTISWMSPITAHWVRSNSSFAERFAIFKRDFPAI